MYVKTLRVVLAKPLYTTLFLVISFFVLSVAIMLPHVGLIRTLWQYESVSVVEILLLIANLYGSLGTNFTILSASYTVIIALLFGMQVTLLTYYLKAIRNKTTNLTSVGASGIGGLISGFLGIGCAACGTFLFTSVLALSGAGGVIAYLPFNGGEFGLLGVVLLTYANYVVLKKITAPFVCAT